MTTATQKLDFIISLTDKITPRLGKVMKTLDMVQTKYQKGLMGIGSGAAGLYAVKSGFDAMTGKAIEFETAMADINRVKNFANPQAMNAFGDKLLSLTHDIPMLGVELAKISEQGAALPLDDKGLLDFTRQVAYNTVAWGMSADETGSHMVALSKKLDIPIEKIARFSDTINYLTNKTGTAPSETLDTINRMGAQMKALNFTPQQIAALGNTFTELKVAPDQAGTAITNMMLKLGAARTESKGVRGAFQDLGLSVDQLEANIKSAGGQATFNDILVRLAKLDEISQRNVSSELFGKEHAGKLTSLIQRLDVYRKNLALAGDTQAQLNSSQIEFQIRADTSAGRIARLNNLFDHMRIRSGNVFTGILSEAFPELHTWMKTLDNDMGTFVEKHPMLAKMIGYAVVGFGLLAAVASVGAIAFGIFSLSTMVLGGAFAILTSPIFLTIAALGVLWLIFKYGNGLLEQFRSYLIDVGMQFLKTIGFFSMVDSVIAKWDSLKVWWGNFKTWFAGLHPLEAIFGWIDSILAKVSGIGAAFRSAFSFSFPLFKSPVISIPPVSTAPKAPSGPGIGQQINNAINHNGVSRRTTTINVSNHGAPMSGARLVNQMRLAGG